MRGVKKAISIVGESEGGNGEKNGRKKKKKSDASAIARISRGREGVPESVGGYSLEMNSRINVRWKNEDGRGIECGRTGSGWQVEVHEDGGTFVVSEHGSFEDALGNAEALMSGGDTADGVPPEFEEEVEKVLESIDSESMEAIEEVGDAFGD